MSSIVYRIQALLEKILANVPVGTNLGLMHLLLTILSGRLLTSRGALFPALDDFGLAPDAVRRANEALRSGSFAIDDLVANWKKAVEEEGHFAAHSHEGIQPVPADMTGFFRPQLQATLGKHYHSQSEKALPAISLGLVGTVGSVGPLRLATIQAIVAQQAGDLSQKALRQLTVQKVKELLKPGQAAILDAEFTPEELLDAKIGDFVVRGASNFAARRNFLPDYKGIGRHPEYGEIVRPLARTYKNKEIAATPWDEQTHWKVGKRTVKAYVWNNLVPEGSKPGDKSLRCVVIVDPKYKHPLVLVTTLCVSAHAVWCLYTDRWPIEQIPLCAKQMLGAVRAFVFSKESRVRLPALALLAGNVLSYVAASSPAVATGFWDRCARPTCGRLRRALMGLHFRDLAPLAGQIRKKASVTEHLPKGVLAHRRQKAVTDPGKPITKAA